MIPWADCLISWRNFGLSWHLCLGRSSLDSRGSKILGVHVVATLRVLLTWGVVLGGLLAPDEPRISLLNGVCLGEEGLLRPSYRRGSYPRTTHVRGVGASKWGWVTILLCFLVWGVTWVTCPRLAIAEWVYIRGSCREGSDPSGPNDMGSELDLAGDPSFPFLTYSPAPACRLASGASLGWEEEPRLMLAVRSCSCRLLGASTPWGSFGVRSAGTPCPYFPWAWALRLLDS